MATHSFIYKVGPNGEQNQKGDLTFDATGVASLTIETSTAPTTLQNIENFTALMDLVGKIMTTAGGIKMIKIVEN